MVNEREFTEQLDIIIRLIYFTYIVEYLKIFSEKGQSKQKFFQRKGGGQKRENLKV